MGDQRRLRPAFASAQSRQSFRCWHTWSMDVDEGSDQNQTCSPTGWLRMHFWRMSLRRTQSTIISWHCSISFLLNVCHYLIGNVSWKNTKKRMSMTTVIHQYVYIPLYSYYRNVPNVSDRQHWANSVEPDQTVPIQGLVCIFWTHHCIVKQNPLRFRIVTAIFQVSEF